MTLKPKGELFQKGFDRGNYGSAYESQDWDTWYCNHCTEFAESDEYREGMLLGFFSSYEIHEISDDDQAETVHTLRAQYGED